VGRSGEARIGKLRLGQIVIASGGGPFNRAMFERKVLGSWTDDWNKAYNDRQ
jgi:hypothetical protein